MVEQQVPVTAGTLDGQVGEELVARASARARRWAAAAEEGPDRISSARQLSPAARLAALLHDPVGVAFTLHFVDRVARPPDDGAAARALARLAGRPRRGTGRERAGLPSFLDRRDRALLRAGAALAPWMPRVVVPLARRRLRRMVGHLVLDAGDRSLRHHLAVARRAGFRLNLNLLGEAVLGTDEADRRLESITALVGRDDVDYVSVKASSVAAQLVPWDLEGNRDRLVERLAPLYRRARDTGTFVNLDMEEYADLDLTVAAFIALLSRPDLRDLSAGIVLQAYLPDALAALERLATFATERVAAGGAPIKVRLVKGANLAMEKVDAELHGWAQAPYPTKAEVDANYVRLLDRAIGSELAGAVRVGVASHHLHHVALALELAAARGVSSQVDVEMLQGMAPAQARAVAAEVPAGSDLVLYTPVVHAADFDAAVSYLVRRLEENAAPENYLYTLLSPDPGAGVDAYEERFRASVRDRHVPPTAPRRLAPHGPLTSGFRNEPDLDPARAEHRTRALAAVSAPPRHPRVAELSDPADVDAAVARALAAPWRHIPARERAAVLRAAARGLAEARDELLTVMAGEAGKTVTEADPEISEAIDFAAYYAERADELAGAPFTPDRVVVVTPPWNFPIAIPLGGPLAALAAGAAAILKPAPEVRACAEVGVAALHRAGVPTDALQLVPTDEGAAGRRLVTHPDVDHVVLTGASETAALFRSWRPDLGLIAETSGKNAMVITPSADPDLAVADLVRSAFGHAGQKCSAASLAILVGSMGGPGGPGRRFRRQLADAVRTLRVGWPDDLGTRVGPLIAPPGERLHRALTTLDPGERWLVAPRRLDERRWTPGVREGVAPGSWFHTTECFGPVLGLMHARDLDEALAWQHGTGTGLTGGLHALDPDEIAHWSAHVRVGNAYVNRHMTGAIVARQSFGGWGTSVVGPGGKPGGPHYVAQFGVWRDGPLADLTAAPLDPAAADVLAAAARDVSPEDLAWLRAAAGSDAAAWRDEFSREHDPTGLRAEANVFRYRPLPRLRLVTGEGATPRDVLRVRLAAAAAGVPVDDHDGTPLEPGERVRVVGTPPDALRVEAGRVGASLLDAPPVADGRREMLTVVREQALSRTRHRFGHIED